MPSAAAASHKPAEELLGGPALPPQVTAYDAQVAGRRTLTVVNDRMVWIDCEMTGLDTDADALIEVAALVTDFELNVIGEGVDIVIKPPAAAVEQMVPVVRRMHTDSGLLAELDGGVDLSTAEHLVLDYVREHVPEARRAPLAGNSVGTDRLFLARDMPQLESYLHYRVVDVSSIKELARRWYPRVYFASPAKAGNHRALEDIQESIEELRYYRATVFVEPPGPDSETARAHAAEHGGSLTAAEAAVRAASAEATGRGAAEEAPGVDEPVS
jgi:oligoribonuclease